MTAPEGSPRLRFTLISPLRLAPDGDSVIVTAGANVTDLGYEREAGEMLETDGNEMKIEFKSNFFGEDMGFFAMVELRE